MTHTASQPGSAYRHSASRLSPIALSVKTTDIHWRKEPALSGDIRWTHTTAGVDHPVPLCAAPLAVSGVGVVVAGYDGRICFYDPTLSRQYWSLQLSAPIYASIVALPASQTFLVCDTKGGCLRVNLKGTVLWKQSMKAPIYGTLCADEKNGSVYIAAFGDYLFHLDIDTGNILNSRTLAAPWFKTVAPKPASRNPYVGPILIGDARVLTTSGGTLEVFNATLERIWSHSLKAIMRATPAVHLGLNRILAISVAGEWILLDSLSGSCIASGHLEDKVTASPALSGPIACIGTANGRVVGLCLETSAIIWDRGFGAPFDHTGFSVLPDGSFLCTHQRGNMIARDAGTGGFLWESSQAIGQSGYGTRLDSTPVSALDGTVYCGSYSGAFYAFSFDRAS